MSPDPQISDHDLSSDKRSIRMRKADHIRINLNENVAFPNTTTGLEHYRFTHCALPELNLADVDMSLELFGKRLTAPILVSSMTGGTGEASAINRTLAQAAQEYGLAMGLGSQRAGIEQPETAATFRVRDVAPDILLFADLGAIQLNYGFGVAECRQAVDMVKADALILHLNPLQEAVQQGGDLEWAGLADRMAEVCAALHVPVIVKEVGWGISYDVAKLLIEAGVSVVDVAGAGGTSWSQVEMHRAPTERMQRLAASFADWGLPTTDSILAVAQARGELKREDVHIFASGGIRSGQDIAKCVALGADLVGLASPFLRKAVESAQEVVEEMDLLATEMRIAMFSSGAGDIQSLRRKGVLTRI